MENSKYYAGKIRKRFVEEIKKRKTPMRIAVDVMGADRDPGLLIKGASSILKGDFNKTEIFLVGKEDEILRHGEGYLDSDKVSIVDAQSEITMSDDGTEMVRNQDSSIAIGMELMQDDKADAFISFGNTGAVLANAMLRITSIPGVKRPPLMTLFPTVKGSPSIVLDIGANSDCKPEHLYQFGALGSIYAKNLLHRNKPTVGLLSIGEEKNKGNNLTKEAFDLLQDSDLNFVGNIEGRDILFSKADVIVCDGFVGNIVLKFAESMYGVVSKMIKESANKNLYSKIGGFLLKKSLKKSLKSFDYSEYGGAPLLGIDGVCVIGHGSTSSKAVKNAIFLAQQMIVSNLNNYYREYFSEEI